MTYLTDPFAVPELPAQPERPASREHEPATPHRAPEQAAPEAAEATSAPSAPDSPSAPDAPSVLSVPNAPTAPTAPSVPTGDDIEVEAPAPVVLTQPADGLPDVVTEETGLLEAAAALRSGTGPFAVDAERASGYRYGQRAYLVQVRREGAGTWLIDPVACPDLGPIDEAVAGVEWILHAATQDLGCLREVGLTPSALFDTELGARLAGLPRVGLAAVVEHYLGVSLAKEHSAVDWSTRPLPEDWLRYAALDVELLADVRDAMAADLEQQGKAEWARQEFDALTSFTGHPVRVDPWRRVSGLRRLRTPRMAAIVRELWYARDDLARARDISPGRVVPDAVLVALATAAPTDVRAAHEATTHRVVRRHPEVWVEAVRRALDLPESRLPATSLPNQGPPPPKSWADRDPLAAARLAMAREALGAFAEQHRLPLENLLSPDTLRRVVWTPPQHLDESSVHDELRELGARPWQADIAAPVLAHAFATARPV
ncbi:HRDC domain-containing protein [Mobilicoccus massiliensis]|uniref:HRDC domain-containing protein n=1 Tax=Mobilicoccus massiliensis TaxID=1522310 RepID=UPI0009E2248B|nr:HRDC domain-containing protein [Mobilicoccus massiliensis]